jgi:ABC-2 type transport system ATP-binding protein
MNQASEPVLRIESLGARAGSRWILRDVSFEACAGEITAVIGPNGAGKTTLLETIVGLRRADAGSVRVKGRRLTRFADFANVVAFLPDAGTLPPEATVRTLVDEASSLGLRSASALQKELGIEPLLGEPVGALSRGEGQRVALFCTLVLGRPIVVLDEPFSAFDPLQLRRVLAVVREVAGPTTSVIASIHQLADAEKIADRVLLLAGGRSVAFGDVASLRTQAGLTSGSLEDAFVSLLSGSTDAS